MQLGIIMQKAERLALSTARSILEPDGLSVALGAGARHPQILVHAPDGWSRRFTIACSARADDQCQSNYARQKATAVLREFRASRAPSAGLPCAMDPRAGPRRAAREEVAPPGPPQRRPKRCRDRTGRRPR